MIDCALQLYMCCLQAMSEQYDFMRLVCMNCTTMLGNFLLALYLLSLEIVSFQFESWQNQLYGYKVVKIGTQIEAEH